MKPNHNPKARNDSAATIEDTPSSIAVLSNDRDSDRDPLSITAVSEPANGTTVINPDGGFTYTPAADFSGADTFQYTASDGNGGSNTATVTVAVSRP